MPQLKQPITSIDQMTCEHCIYFQTTPKCGEPYCISPDSDDWDREKEETCSHGEWLYFGKWWDEAASPDKLQLMDYSSMYHRFAELVG